MKKQELELMEIYVYANHIDGLSSCIIEQNLNNNFYIENFGNFAKNLSSTLLKKCEKKIKRKKLNTLSFLILKKEISSFKFYKTSEKNLNDLCFLLEKYKYYENMLSVLN